MKRSQKIWLGLTGGWAIVSVIWMAIWVANNSFDALVSSKNFPVDLMFSFGPLVAYLATAWVASSFPKE